MEVSFIGLGHWSTRRKPPTMLQVIVKLYHMVLSGKHARNSSCDKHRLHMKICPNTILMFPRWSFMILLWYFLFCPRWKWYYNQEVLASLLAIAHVAKSQFNQWFTSSIWSQLRQNMFTIKPIFYDLPMEHWNSSLKTGGCLIQFNYYEIHVAMWNRN